MRFKKIYTFIKIILCIFIIGFSAFVDIFFIVRGRMTNFWIFFALEVVLLVYTYLLFRYIDKTVLSVKLRKNAVKVETLGGSYSTTLDQIRVIKGRLNYYIFKIPGKSLRVYQSNKAVNAFIKKYFVRIDTNVN